MEGGHDSCMKSSDGSGSSPRSRKPKPWVPPRGIRYFADPKRTTPFVLQWRDRNDGGRRREQSFRTESLREEAAKELVQKRADYGREILSFDPREWRRWLEFKTIVGGVDPLEVAREWKQQRELRLAEYSITVGEAVAKYLELRRTEDLSSDTLRHIRNHLARFAERCGEMRLSDVTPDHVRDWLSGLSTKRSGATVEEVTRRHHRKDLSAFFRRAIRERWCTSNPCEAVPPPRVVLEEVRLLTLQEAERLFRVNATQPVVGRMACEAFGGLRYTSAARLQRSHVDFDSRGISMPGRLHKSGKRKYRQGQPENLWEWLKVAPDLGWEMTPLQYRTAKREAFLRADVPFGHNTLRHSFASYHLALGGDPSKTAYQMQHTGIRILLQVYEGVAKKEDAEAYFSITP